MIWSLFKGKAEKTLDDTLAGISAQIFPMGESDIRRDCERVDILTNAKLPDLDLRAFVTGSKALVAINTSYDDDGFIRSFIARSKNRINETETRDVYVYLAGESIYRARMVAMMRGGGSDISSDLLDSLEDLGKTWKSGTDKDKIPGGRGEFGLCVDNPVPTVCVNGSNVYLSRLRRNGSPVEFRRLGSTSTPVTVGNVDIYQLSQAGTDLAKIYICPYHRKDSKIAPVGFRLEL